MLFSVLLSFPYTGRLCCIPVEFMRVIDDVKWNVCAWLMSQLESLEDATDEVHLVPYMQVVEIVSCHISVKEGGQPFLALVVTQEKAKYFDKLWIL